MDGTEAPVTSFNQLAELLYRHEAKSQDRFETLQKEICHLKEKCEAKEMSDGINTDKVIVNAGSGGGESGGLSGLAALMMASRGDDSQSNIWASILPALTNQDRGGMNNMWPLLLLLFARGGFGGINGCGADGGCGPGASPAQAAILQSLMDNLSELRAQIPTTALETQNALQNALAQLALGMQQGFAGIKDSVQASLLALSQSLASLNQNVSAQGCQTREWVTMENDKTRTLLNARFSQEDATKIAEQNARIVALETRCDHDRRFADQNLVITNTNNAIANQQQQQQQSESDRRHRELLAELRFISVGNQVQLARNVNDTINFGTMAASGIQTTPTTQVR